MAPGQRREDKHVFSVSFEKQLIQQIKELCEEKGYERNTEFENRNAFIIKAVQEKLKKENEKK